MQLCNADLHHCKPLTELANHVVVAANLELRGEG
jgi:hypothetical protein